MNTQQNQSVRHSNHPIIIVVCFVIISILACNMSASAPSPDATPVVVQPTATDSPAASLTPSLTLTVTPRPAATATPRIVVPTAQPLPLCNLRTDWPVYTVIAGDTLAAVARRTNTNVDVLTNANCLVNPNSLNVGQQLYVPQLPVTPTAVVSAPRIVSFVLSSGFPPQLIWQTENASEVMIYVSDSTGENRSLGNFSANGVIPLPQTSGVATFRLNVRDLNGQIAVGPDGLSIYAIAQTSGGPGNAEPECPLADDFGSGQILVSPVDAIWSSCIYLNPNQTVTVTWDAMPPSITRIEYYFAPVAGACDERVLGNPDVIGTDFNLTDGNSVAWFIGTEPCAGVLYAFGYPGTGLMQSPQLPIVIR